MADEQSQTSSAEPQQTPDAQSSEPSSDQPEKQSSESPSWWRRMFGRRGDEEETEASSADKAKDVESSKPTPSREELERQVQAEVDRREYKRQQEAKLRQRRELRDNDPFAYAEEERKDEQIAQGSVQVQQFVGSIGLEHDRATIDPIFTALPQAEQERIQKLEGAGVGLAGRKLVVSESLKALEKHWKAEGAKDAEARLRKNPAFRKQVLSELRGQAPEPDLLPAGSPSEADKTVSDLLRTHYRMG